MTSVALMLSGSSAYAAPPAATPTSSELLHQIQGLGHVGSVLYVAAHPDDENTRLLAYLANQRHLRTAYLSMTRGGGGQNLIGREQAELLGVIRTGELMEARRVDGAQQFFTRARDFGYSKTPDETLKTWGKTAALDDVVRVVRAFRPDVIITRFRPSGRNHGHHTASAMLASDAFRVAAEPKRFEAHFKDGLKPWRAARIIHNQSHWRLRRMKNPDLSKFIYLDVGGFDPLLGKSYGEIAGLSRSMHKSQGFGAAQVHGPIDEYFEPIAGSPPSKTDIFANLDFTWGRYPDTGGIIKAHADAVAAFDPRNPAASLPKLAALHKALKRAKLPEEGAHWRAIKLADLEDIMVHAAGLRLTARAPQSNVAPGAPLTITLTALNRGSTGDIPVAVSTPKWSGQAKPHAPLVKTWNATIPKDTPLTTPSWLAQTPTAAAYRVQDSRLINRPDDPAPLHVDVSVTLAGVEAKRRVPVLRTQVDPVRGELSRPVEVLPRVAVNLDRSVVLAAQGARAQTLTVSVTDLSDSGSSSGRVQLKAPPGWRVTPSVLTYGVTGGNSVTFKVKVTPRRGAKAGSLKVRVSRGASGDSIAYSATAIAYEHLTPRTVLRPTTARLIPVDLQVPKGRRVAYVQGSGDVVDQALASIGYSVDTLSVTALAAADLNRYDAVVFGVRAFNKFPALYKLHPKLMTFVTGGGTVVVQYNTHNRIQRITGPVGPYPFGISRGRVTDETAAVNSTSKTKPHRLLTHPHRLGPEDWRGWVQERGLYFAETWDSRYETPLSMADPGEKPNQGSLLVTRHGKGAFIYTGLSLFRQIPAGVPGAFRLLVNMVEHAK